MWSNCPGTALCRFRLSNRPMTTSIYTFLFSGILLLWPIFLFAQNLPILGVAAAVLNLAMFVLVCRAISGRAYGYWSGFEQIAQSWMSGCANITLLYIFPVML